MKQGAQKDGGWLLKFMVVFAGIALAGAFLRSCYKLITLDIAFQTEPYNTAIRVHTLPEKRVYLAGVDTEIDLAGGELCYAWDESPLADDGTCGGEGCEDFFSMEEGLRNIDRLSVYTDADFTDPGMYHVIFRSLEDYDGKAVLLSCSFPIVVIDPKDAVR